MKRLVVHSLNIWTLLYKVKIHLLQLICFHFKIRPLKKTTGYIYQMLCPALQELQQMQNWWTTSPPWTGPHSMSWPLCHAWHRSSVSPSHRKSGGGGGRKSLQWLLPWPTTYLAVVGRAGVLAPGSVSLGWWYLAPGVVPHQCRFVCLGWPWRLGHRPIIKQLEW